jgi:hypothetical protein
LEANVFVVWGNVCLIASGDVLRCEKKPGRVVSLRNEDDVTGDDLDDASACERVMGDGAALCDGGGDIADETKDAAAAATAAAPAELATRASSNEADTWVAEGVTWSVMRDARCVMRDA